MLHGMFNLHSGGHTVIWLIAAAALVGCNKNADPKDEGLASAEVYAADLETIPERANAHGFPRLANNTQVSYEGDADNGRMGEKLAERLHWYDYIVVDGDFVTNDVLGQHLGPRGPLRTKNPNAVVTAYFSPADYLGEDAEDGGIRWRELMRTYAFGPSYNPEDQTDSNPEDGFQRDAWLFHTTATPPGEPEKHVPGPHNEVWLFDFGDYWSKLQDPSEQGMREHYVTTFNEVVVSKHRVDGIYHDWATATAPSFGTSVPKGHRTSEIDLDLDGVAEPITEINTTWREGLLSLFALGRSTYPENFLLTGNLGWFSQPAYTDYLSGIMMEDFNSAALVGGWGRTMYAYASYMQNGRSPHLSIVQAVIDIPNDTATNDVLYHDIMAEADNVWFASNTDPNAHALREMRFSLASALMFDGYFSASNSAAAGGYHAAWWLDEFSVNLETGASVFPAQADGSPALAHKGWMGDPTGAAVQVGDVGTTLWSLLSVGVENAAAEHAWRRKFENALVLVNPTQAAINANLDGSWQRIDGRLAPNINNGEAVSGSVSLPAEDGLVLVRR